MSAQRLEFLQQLNQNSFDLLIIGGGVTGAGIALDAAARGLKTALVEKRDFASGTSSKSTKLIHGGLRYLKQFEIGLVREVGRERAIVHRLAPHLVKSEKMLLPIIRGGTYNRLASSIGLWLYDFLAGVRGNDRRRMLTRQQALQQEPLLRKEDLMGGGLYAEYRTDDARLTIENIKTAVRHGAVCVNYAKAGHFLYQKGRIAGCTVTDHFTGEQTAVKASCTVNAAGPWVDDLRQIDHPVKGKHLFLSKGVHIVVPAERLPLRQAVYFDVPGGRMLFAIPRQRATYIGTTDTAFKGDPNQVFAQKDEVEYLLAGANAMFPDAGLTLNDVESSWAGLRPLIYEEGKSPGEMSRKDEIFISQTGLISIAGGKLTGYRKMAERVVNLVSEQLKKEHGRTTGPCLTAKIPLSSTPFRDAGEVAVFQESLLKRTRNLQLPDHYAVYLCENFGRDANSILEKVNAAEVPAELSLLENELSYCLEHEFVMKPADFFERRTGRLYFNLPSVREHLDFVLRIFQRKFAWDEGRFRQEKNAMLALIDHVSRF